MKTAKLLKTLSAIGIFSMAVIMPHANAKPAPTSTSKSTNSFAPYSGTWYSLDTQINKKIKYNPTVIPMPNDTKAIAKLKKQCGQEFHRTIYQTSGKKIQDTIKSGIDSIQSLAETNNDEQNPEIMAYVTGQQEDIKQVKAYAPQFAANRQYWAQEYACGDASEISYFLSPNKAILLIYAGGETQFSIAVQ